MACIGMRKNGSPAAREYLRSMLVRPFLIPGMSEDRRIYRQYEGKLSENWGRKALEPDFFRTACIGLRKNGSPAAREYLRSTLVRPFLIPEICGGGRM
jgi:hypothetical protein